MKNFSLLFAALVALPFTLAAGATRAADVETPTMGWSSWNAFRVNISEGTIKHHADLVKELELDKCGYVYINIDDGYFGGRDEKRLERRIYEGETAWMETYQELKNPVEAGTAYYKQVPEASGGVVASQVGGKGGPLFWRHVWSAKGGKYSLKLYTFGEGGKIVLSLNGRPVALKDLAAAVTLKPGDNEVKVTGAETLPDIDFLEVSAR